MTFKQSNIKATPNFNSDASSKLIDNYVKHVNLELTTKSNYIPSKSFVPSGMRCDRRSWFRLRGVRPDVNENVDIELDFIANIGNACHVLIQKRLASCYKDRWVDVAKYFEDELYLSYPPDSYEVSKRGYETLVKLFDPPIKFACDGILKIDDQYILLEIKSCEYSSWIDMERPKSEHIDQITTYCTLLDIDKCLMLYVDRQYGNMKCYEVDVSIQEKRDIKKRMQYVMDMVDKHIAPKGLPVGDKWCSPSYCPYYKKCKEYGR